MESCDVFVPEVLLHAIWFIAVSLTCDGKIEEIEDSTIPHSFNSVEFLISTNLTLIPHSKVI